MQQQIQIHSIIIKSSQLRRCLLQDSELNYEKKSRRASSGDSTADVKLTEIFKVAYNC